jgi:(1->4)-alpha-D-glucan 1-alpha-D-glucosylmutase
MAGEWQERVERWLELTEPLRSERGAPDDHERYFIFQTLIGAWPIELRRLEAYVEKALREAKRNTSWVDGDPEWERDVSAFVRGLYGHGEFLLDFEPFARLIALAGDRIALGMVALKLTVPGVPDIYQGDELSLHALVDPDNRRPVDWGWNQAMLARLLGGSEPDRHTAKLWLTMRLLQLRIRHPDAFAGAYTPLAAGDECVAFMRGEEILVIVAARHDPPAGELAGTAGVWRDVLRGERRRLGEAAPLAELLGRRGLAVLERAVA